MASEAAAILMPGRRTPSVAAITGACIVLLLVWEWLGADLPVMQLLADARGFPLRENRWLGTVFHEGLRNLSVLAFIALALAVWKPFGFLRRHTRRERLQMLIGVSFSLILVSALKHNSLTSCPWDLQQFGGVARHVPHWLWAVADGGPGRCFPSGHASSGFAYFAVALPGLLSATDEGRRRGRRILAVVLLLGAVCGIAQVLRGAHYPSHVMWTALFCWSAALLNHRLFSRMTQ